MRYRSGDLEFDPTTATLHRPAREVRLRKQLALTLKLLMEREGDETFTVQLT